MKRQPALTVSAITAAVAAVLALLTAFGFHLTADQKTAILGVVAVVAPLVSGAFTWGKVTPAAQIPQVPQQPAQQPPTPPAAPGPTVTPPQP